MMKLPALLIALIGFLAAPVRADGPATAPSADDPPAPAALAPIYLSIGKDISLRLQLVRQTLDELKLDPAILAQARRLIDSPKRELDSALDEMEAGHMPSARRVYSVHDVLRNARERLFALIGEQEARLLEEKMSSLRGEARWRIGQLRNGLDELKLPDARLRQCDAIPSAAAPAVEQLPAEQLDGPDYDSNRRQMNQILSDVHDRLAALLSPREQACLGARFSNLCDSPPATRP